MRRGKRKDRKDGNLVYKLPSSSVESVWFLIRSFLSNELLAVLPSLPMYCFCLHFLLSACLLTLYRRLTLDYGFICDLDLDLFT